MLELSVIIPTHKRADILRQCLDHLEQQTIARKLEVIVVSDGHDEEASQLCAHFTGKIPVVFLEIEKAQQGVARNRGVEKAQAPLCLLLGDDIFLQKDACEAHLVIHTVASSDEFAHHGTTAVLGHTTWDPTVQITPVMHWLEKSGWQFGYRSLQPYAMKFVPKKIQHRFSYTSHISLPTAVARDVPFREDVSLYGWEDMEWGMRIRKANVRLFYNDTAKGLHHHTMILAQSLERMKILGTSAVHMKQKVPSFDRLPPLWKQWVMRLMIALTPGSMASQHRRAFLKGIQDA
ncbi:hypothetical protein COU76_04965 [Candidatus Peregrinibacteria bacterium CG10_big_fil_rev_8_21_14_0_10_49_10]|nr:MAG: hypothetical protein COU76_04965 [Candidatus Peregrinibacteria bacterium CG10_big_fil_rev_8_21_14_0_10_49_10]